MRKIDIPKQIIDPISIRMGDKENMFLADEINPDSPLSKGAMIGGEHYGFILIIDENGNQKEKVYQTQLRIEAAELNGDKLIIYEQDKKEPWVFSITGQLLNSADDKFTEEFVCSFIAQQRRPDLKVSEEPIFLNPLLINVALDPKQSKIVFPKDDGDDTYPVNPGLILSGTHFGFTLRIASDKDKKNIVYKTQNSISSVGVADPNDKYSDICIYEEGKFHPWRFSYDGILQQKAMYEEASRRDHQFIQSSYGVTMQEAETQYSIDVKKL